MISFEDVITALQAHNEQVKIPSVSTFVGLHKWLLDKGHLKQDEAVLILLEGAAYVIYAEFPSTTLVVHCDRTPLVSEFSVVTKKRLYGEYKSPYKYSTFLQEMVVESWMAHVVISILAAVAVMYSNLDLLIDKSIDIAAIGAAFLTLFLSFKSEPRKADDLWFRRGEYRKHFKIDRFSLVLMGNSLAVLVLAMMMEPLFHGKVLGKIGLGVLIALGWASLYSGFRLVVTFHIDRLEAEGEKELADRVREAASQKGR